MSSPTIFELLDFETQIEAAVKSILTTGVASLPSPASVQINVSRDSDTATTPRWDIMFATGNCIKQWATFGADPKQIPIAFDGVLTIINSTTRPDDNARADPLHGTLRGALRYFMSAAAKKFTTTNLPWLQILEILPVATRPQLQENKEQDIDVLQFSVKFAIRTEYYPSSPP